MLGQKHPLYLTIIDDDIEDIELLTELLEEPSLLKFSNYKFSAFTNIKSAVAEQLVQKTDLLLLDLNLILSNGIETLKIAQQQLPHIPIIVLTGLYDSTIGVSCIREGATDFLVKNQLTGEKLWRSILYAIERFKLIQSERKALHEIQLLKAQLEAENLALKEEIKLAHNFDEIITNSNSYEQVLKQIEQVANTDATVLILGESGTGKELLARAVHTSSKRNKYPLVTVNCAALPANLIESELFGHEKGAFTGAIQRKIGRFELADNGTLFLDEIGELPMELQSKLLRVLQEGEFERLGNPKTIKTDVRIIAATNRDLLKSIQEKRFREDLYYRLNVFPIVNIPLRDRKEDIPLLTEHFIQKFNTKIGRNVTHISTKIMKELTSYDWPGNVRELENIIERAIIISTGKYLQIDTSIFKKRNKNQSNTFVSFEEMQRQYIIKALKKCKWRITGANGAASLLKLKDKTLYSKMRKLGIRRIDFMKE